MKGSLLLSLIMFSIILLSIDGQDNQNINKTLASTNSQKDINVSSLPPDEKKPKRCGTRNFFPFRYPFDPLIGVDEYNNTLTQYGEFPWMVAVFSEEIVEENTEKVLIYKCGASLIHPQVVLTSAHCVTSKDSKFSIRAGEWDPQTDLELFPHQNRNVENVIIHPDFNKRTLYNDVALLILDKPLEISENVKTVCLPPQNEVFENSTCYYTSWDRAAFKQETTSSFILYRSELRIIQHDDCEERLRRARLGNNFVLDKSFICSEGGSTCNGSGGSPIVCLIPGQSNNYYHSGMLSWGIACVEQPRVYGNVAAFRNWIDSEMLKLNYDISTYTY